MTLAIEQLRGAYVAVTTPFADGDFAPDVFTRHLEYLLEGGVSGIVPCGTTGEAATMTATEKATVIGRAVDVVAGRVPVIAGVGTNDTASTIQFARDALDAGADGLLVVTPYYNKPPQQGLFEHFAAVARATRAPIVLYNVPGRTSVSLTVETVDRLADIPEVVAIKEATGDMRFASEVIKRVGQRIAVMSGDDFTAMPLVALGGTGVISVVGNAAPRRTSEMVHAALDGDLDTARDRHYQLLPLVDALFVTTNPIPVKYAVSALGFGTAQTRPPLCPADGPTVEGVNSALAGLGLVCR